MGLFLGIDTSNYTTSVALYDTNTNEVISKKQLLPIEKGARGIRQSDAVFHHTKQLPELITRVMHDVPGKILAVGVSEKPCDHEGSYMPCFLSGIAVASGIADVCKVPLYKFSHQRGHIAAAIYSCDSSYLYNKNFIAVHVSGGTTDVISVVPDADYIIKTTNIGGSSDLKAGQLVDRVGVYMGLDFPCGKQIEAIALESKNMYKIKPSVKGTSCSISGFENKCLDMIKKGIPKSDVAMYLLQAIYSSIYEMCSNVLLEYPETEFLFVGGVMSNSIIRQQLEQKFNCKFAKPEFSCDNAAGIALLTARKELNL